MQHRNRGEIQGISGRRLVGAYAALAENHVLVARAHDVLGAHQELLDGVCETAL